MRPQRYEELQDKFQPGSQRLVVFPLDSAAELLQQAVAATEDILDNALPPGALQLLFSELARCFCHSCRLSEGLFSHKDGAVCQHEFSLDRSMYEIKSSRLLHRASSNTLGGQASLRM